MRVLTCVAVVLSLMTLGFLGCGSQGGGTVPTAPTGGSGSGGTVSTPQSDVEGLKATGPVAGTRADTETTPPAVGDKPAGENKPEGDKPAAGDTKGEDAKPAGDKPTDEKKSDGDKPADDKKPQ